MSLESALRMGRAAAAVLEAPPHDLFAGYGPDEVAAQYAATDRLLTAFRRLDEHLTPTKETP